MAKAKSNSKKITLEESLVPVEEQPYEVPENWCWVKHNSILDISGGSQPANRILLPNREKGIHNYIKREIMGNILYLCIFQINMQPKLLVRGIFCWHVMVVL